MTACERCGCGVAAVRMPGPGYETVMAHPRITDIWGPTHSVREG